MSQRRKKPRRALKRPPAAPPGPDVDRLFRLAIFEGLMEVDGDPYPLVAPRRDYSAEPDGHMDFDREMCRAGLKAFVRPTMPSDTPDPSSIVEGDPLALAIFGPFTEPYILVREFRPGVRSRMGIEIAGAGVHEPSAN